MDRAAWCSNVAKEFSYELAQRVHRILIDPWYVMYYNSVFAREKRVIEEITLSNFIPIMQRIFRVFFDFLRRYHTFLF